MRELANLIREREADEMRLWERCIHNGIWAMPPEHAPEWLRNVYRSYLFAELGGVVWFCMPRDHQVIEHAFRYPLAAGKPGRPVAS